MHGFVALEIPIGGKQMAPVGAESRDISDIRTKTLPAAAPIAPQLIPSHAIMAFIACSWRKHKVFQ
jgi:hypothetical protein